MNEMGMAAAKADPTETSAPGEEGPPTEELEVTSELELGMVLHALSDPMRLRIVADLARDGERTCNSFGLPIVKSTCTHHIRVLRESGVIRQRVQGNTRVNSLRREELDSQFPGLLDAVLEAAGHAPAPVS